MITRCFLILTFLGFIGNAHALTIKLGTLAPANTPWHYRLFELASEWSNISDGEINIKVFPGGIAGSEEDMVRKMRLGQLQAAALSILGTGRIYSGARALSWPRLIRTPHEADFVVKEVSWFLNQEMEKRGFVSPIWSLIGWAHIFSRHPVKKNADLMDQKLHVSDNHAKEIKAWQRAGFNVVPLPTTEIMLALQSGMIDAYISSPTAAIAFQWFGITPHMNSMQYAPLFATLVVSKKTWEKIPEKYHVPFQLAADEISKKLSDAAKNGDQLALEQMEKMGLTIESDTRKIAREWDQMMEEHFYPALIKKNVIDSTAYEHIKEALARYHGEVR